MAQSLDFLIRHAFIIKNGFSQVRIQKNDTFAILCQCLAEIERNGTLAFIRETAGQSDALFVLPAEIDIRSQLFIIFADGFAVIDSCQIN